MKSLFKLKRTLMLRGRLRRPKLNLKEKTNNSVSGRQRRTLKTLKIYFKSTRNSKISGKNPFWKFRNTLPS